MRIRPSFALVCLALILTGCALSPTSQPSSEVALSIAGRVHGGQQPISGAHVYLFAANTTGYGGAGIQPSASNASVSLLKAASTGHSDSIGAYVLSGSDGSFSITGDYTCTANTQVYLYALGGNPGAGTNSASGLMAVLGNCPGTTFSSSTFILLNEVSTVAAAYALAGFATDATHVSSSGTALAQTGIANAFANAANLAGLATGSALAVTPNGNGSAPQATVNTLANILAACVNSTGPASSTCSTLLADAPNSSGTQPTDTASAAIDIAQNPTANVAALYTLPTPTAPFAPALTAQPNDFSLTIVFGGCGLNANDSPDMAGIAVDGAGNVWVTNPGSNCVTKLSSSGALLSGATGFTTAAVNTPQGIALDTFGNAWFVNSGSSPSLMEISSSGALLRTIADVGGDIAYAQELAIDPAGYLWVPNQIGFWVSELTTSGTVLSGSPGYEANSLDNPTGAAIDTSGNAWIASMGAVTEISRAGTILSGTNGYKNSALGVGSIAIDASGNIWTAGAYTVSKMSAAGAVLSGSGYTNAYLHAYGGASLAIDGAGNAVVANSFGGRIVTKFSNSGTLLSGTYGFGAILGGVQQALALDGSGDIWIATNGSNQVYELIGASTPVVTPLAAAVAAKMLGTAP